MIAVKLLALRERWQRSCSAGALPPDGSDAIRYALVGAPLARAAFELAGQHRSVDPARDGDKRDDDAVAAGDTMAPDL